MTKTPYFEGFHRLFGRAKLSNQVKLSREIERIRKQSAGQLGSIFSEVIEPEKVEGKKGWRARVFTPSMTLFCMIGQAFGNDPLRGAVRSVQALFAGSKAGEELEVKASTGSYSDARKRLPQDAVDQAHRRVCAKGLVESTLMGGRRVMAVDGTGMKMEDTAANQQEYPQPTNQAEGCGFPVIQVVALLNLGSGMIEHFAGSPTNVSESGLFETELFGHLRKGDILLADRGFCSFLLFALLGMKGVDALMRLNGSRSWPEEFGSLDEGTQTWHRPNYASCPDYISREQWESLPETVSVRYVRRIVKRKGFRDQEIMLATTLTDESAEELGELYLRRWEIELSFDDIKTTLNLDKINAKSPAMAWKVLTTHIIAYNLIRYLIGQAVCSLSIDPRRISFAGTLQSMCKFMARLGGCSQRTLKQIHEKMLAVIASDILPSRPWRIEPRVRKERPKNFPLMTRPRSVLRDEINTAQTI